MNIAVDLARIAASLEAITTLLQRIASDAADAAEPVQKTFSEFAEYYFTTFRSRKVKPITLKKDLSRYRLHIAPALGEYNIHDITPEQVQSLIDSLGDKHKTAHEVYSLLNQIFKAAIKHNLIKHNPMDIVILEQYEKDHGKRLSIDEERLLLQAPQPYRLMFALVLYTGLRPCEYKTVQRKGRFIIARNAKQKDGKEHTKRIPITPMLAPYLADEETINILSPCRFGERLHEILPNHAPKDLRNTFYSHCKECGIAEAARESFMGHSQGSELQDTYTQLSDEYLIAEAKKFKY